MSRGARLAGLASVIGALGVVAAAWAGLPVRVAKLAWDKAGMLHGVLPMRDSIDDPAIAKKLSNGLPVTVIVRGYVYPNSGGDPIALTAHTCRVAYDLWNEVYKVVENGTSRPPVVNMKGVYRHCTDMDLPIADRPTLKMAPADYFVAVKVEVNPVSEDTLKKISSWVTRPSGVSGSIGPGDALFASFVGVFMKKVATADHVVEFQTPPLPP